MALHFELVTPAKLVRSEDVHMVVVPGTEGEFGVLEGHAPFMSTIRDGAVQVYIDNKPVTASPVTEGGDWRIDLPQIDTGVYTLRIDEVDEAGDVVSRLETPFKREEPEEVAAVLAEPPSPVAPKAVVRTVPTTVLSEVCTVSSALPA